jgi:hypothetical protein
MNLEAELERIIRPRVFSEEGRMEAMYHVIDFVRQHLAEDDYVADAFLQRATTWLGLPRLRLAELKAHDWKVARISPGLIAIAWSPDVLSPEEYAALVVTLGNIVRANGGLGVQRVRGHAAAFEMELAEVW